MTRWLLICGRTEEELAGCHAETLEDARRALLGRMAFAAPGSFVVSALSWGLGVVKPLPPTMCSACGVRERGVRDRRCDRCRLGQERDVDRAQGKRFTRRPHTAETREKIRLSNVRTYAAERAARRSA